VITQSRKVNKKSTSFLKKRSKKLLLIAASMHLKRADWMAPRTGKSFLLLFFKKEDFLFFIVCFCRCARAR
jgi:hypothetical protein